MRAFKQGDQDMKDEARIVRVETVMEHINYMLDRMDKRFDAIEKNIDTRFERMDQRFNSMETDFKVLQHDIDLKFDKINERFFDLHKESKVHFRWLMAFAVAILGSPIVMNLISYFHLVKV